MVRNRGVEKGSNWLKKSKKKKLINEVLACIQQKKLKREKEKSGENYKIYQGLRIYKYLPSFSLSKWTIQRFSAGKPISFWRTHTSLRKRLLGKSSSVLAKPRWYMAQDFDSRSGLVEAGLWSLPSRVLWDRMKSRWQHFPVQLLGKLLPVNVPRALQTEQVTKGHERKRRSPGRSKCWSSDLQAFHLKPDAGEKGTSPCQSHSCSEFRVFSLKWVQMLCLDCSILVKLLGCSPIKCLESEHSQWPS